jgi:hypothetical protein
MKSELDHFVLLDAPLTLSLLPLETVILKLKNLTACPV